ncbi:MAG: hypothetical protein R8G34_05970 [Paracoccaceae bacterium]|nr:hypothetical protein [Paracoccaceae bacterium]
MDNQPKIIAIGGLIFGVLLAVAISESRANSKISAALERAQDASATTLSEATESMSARLAELEASLGESSAAAATGLEDKLASLQEDVSARIDAVSEAATAQAQDLEAALSALSAAAVGSSSESTGDATDDMQTSGVLGVGETAVFAEGAVRAFVSGLDRENGSARLSVNGASMSVGVGETATVAGADCKIGVASLSGDGVTVGSDCGMSDASSASALPPAPESGHRPGTVAVMADGALKVFVSGLAGDGSSARIAINGVETQTVGAGASVEKMAGDLTCTVTVTGVGNGMVGLEGSCS